MHGTTQGNLLCSYLYLKLIKHHIFHFIFYVFSSTKLENRRVEQILWGIRGLASLEGESGRERGKRVKMV
jgi:hypothetical protein